MFYGNIALLHLVILAGRVLLYFGRRSWIHALAGRDAERKKTYTENQINSTAPLFEITWVKIE